MKKLIKLIILIIISLSVYFIYGNNTNQNIKVLSIGDNLSKGINSYGIKEYNHIDYYIDYLKTKYKNTNINKKYIKKDLSIKELIEDIKNKGELKKDLRDTDILILTIGYNDILYKLSIEENINIKKISEEITNEYNNLLKEIKKLCPNKIILIGYPKSNKDNYYDNILIRKLNETMKNIKEITYIDTYKLLSNREKYFSNPYSFYPNIIGYQRLGKEIIEKTLEKKENI